MSAELGEILKFFFPFSFRKKMVQNVTVVKSPCVSSAVSRARNAIPLRAAAEAGDVVG